MFILHTHKKETFCTLCLFSLKYYQRLKLYIGFMFPVFFALGAPLLPRVASNFHISRLKEFGARGEKGVLSASEQRPRWRWPGDGCGLMAAHARGSHLHPARPMDARNWNGRPWEMALSGATSGRGRWGGEGRVRSRRERERGKGRAS